MRVCVRSSSFVVHDVSARRERPAPRRPRDEVRPTADVDRRPRRGLLLARRASLRSDGRATEDRDVQLDDAPVRAGLLRELALQHDGHARDGGERRARRACVHGDARDGRAAACVSAVE